MGQKTTVRTNQSMLDICLAETGTIESAFELAIKNGISLTSKLQPGTQLDVDGLPENTQVKEYYKRNKLSPASVEANQLYTGIGYMKIGDDFKVF